MFTSIQHLEDTHHRGHNSTRSSTCATCNTTLLVHRVGVHKMRKWVKRGFQAQLTVTFSWEAEDKWCSHLSFAFIFSFDHVTFPTTCQQTTFGKLEKKIFSFEFVAFKSISNGKSKNFAKSLMPLVL